MFRAGFDPLHSGHIEYLKDAKKLGDLLVVGINSDEWLIDKKGNYFLPWVERRAIIQSLEMVDFAISFDDTDGSAEDCIRKVLRMFPENQSQVIFANGGDRTIENIPEAKYCRQNNVEIVCGVGGHYKLNSSSKILERWKNL